jgi:hypothetical protein
MRLAGGLPAAAAASLGWVACCRGIPAGCDAPDLRPARRRGCIVRLGLPVCRIRLRCIEWGTALAFPFVALLGGIGTKVLYIGGFRSFCGLPAV